MEKRRYKVVLHLPQNRYRLSDLNLTSGQPGSTSTGVLVHRYIPKLTTDSRNTPKDIWGILNHPLIDFWRITVDSYIPPIRNASRLFNGRWPDRLISSTSDGGIHSEVEWDCSSYTRRMWRQDRITAASLSSKKCLSLAIVLLADDGECIGW